MNKKSASTSRRGLWIVGLLAAALVAAAGVAWATLREGSGSRAITLGVDRALLAKAALVDGQLRGAEEFARKLLEERPRDPGAKTLLGKVLLESGKLREARALFDAVHKDHPEQVDALLGLAAIHERQGEPDLAIAVYRRASEMHKEDSRIWKALGMAQYRKGDSMAALFSLRQSQKLRPGQEDVSKLMDEIGMSRASMATNPGRRGDSRAPADPFGDLMPRPGLPDGRMFDPSRPSPLVPDPLEAVRNPGGRGR